MVLYHLPGDMRVRLPARWWLRFGLKVKVKRGRALTGRRAVDGVHEEYEQGLPVKVQL